MGSGYNNFKINGLKMLEKFKTIFSGIWMSKKNFNRVHPWDYWKAILHNIEFIGKISVQGFLQ